MHFPSSPGFNHVKSQSRFSPALVRTARLLSGALVAIGFIAFSPSLFESVEHFENFSPPPLSAISSHLERVAQVTPDAVDLAERVLAGQKAAVVAEVVSGWRVPLGTATKIVSYAWNAGVKRGVDPILIVSLIAKESGFRFTKNHFDYGGDPESKIDPLEPHGLMQVSGRFHPEKFPGGKVKITSDQENVDIGTHILQEYLDIDGGNVQRALQRYNGALGDGESKFAKAVLRFRARFTTAAAVATLHT